MSQIKTKFITDLAITNAKIANTTINLTTKVTGILPVANGGTGQSTTSAAFNALSPITTTGDMIYSASGATNSRLAIGSTSQALTVIGGVPTWATLSIAGGGTGQVTKAAAFDALSPMTTGGDLIYGGASGTGTRLANGTSGQILKSNGGTAAPSWILASGSIRAKYTTTAGQSIPNTGNIIVDFGTQVFDTNGSGGTTVTTGASWHFTAPITGIYNVQVMIRYASATFTIGNSQDLSVFVNGSVVNFLNISPANYATETTAFVLQGGTKLSLSANDTVDFRTSQGETTNRSLQAAASTNYACITYEGV